MTESEGGDRTTHDVTALAAAIAELGIRCSLEARDNLVLLLPASSKLKALQSADTRRAVLALARQHGFTHVAIELPNDRPVVGREADAPLLRD